MTKIRFWNLGNKEICKDDFLPSSSLSIETKGNFFCDQSEFIQCSSMKYSNVQLSLPNKRTLKVDFECLKKGDAFDISFLHQGDICIKGELKNGKIEFYDEKANDKIPLRFLIIATVITFLSLILFELIFKSIYPTIILVLLETAALVVIHCLYYA